MKGKDVMLSDFLSRQRVDRSNSHWIIPISLDMKAILKEKYYSVVNESRYLVQTHSQVKDKGIKLPEVHGVDKGVDPDIKPEWIVRKSQKLIEKSRLEQDREDPRREVDTPIQAQPQVQSKREDYVKEQIVSKQKEGMYVPQTRQNTEKCIAPEYIDRPQATGIQVPFYPDPLMKPPPRPPDIKTQNDRQTNLDLDLEINKDFEENSPYQEGIISEIYQRPD